MSNAACEKRAPATKRAAPPFAELFVACALLTGCTTDEYARQLIQQDTGVGKIREALTGTSEQLVRSGTISAARRYSMPDGTEIDVWIVKATAGEPRGTVLVLHGLRDSKVTYKRLAQMLSGKGFDVVLPDLRAHGRSTGRYVTYGALEKHDQKHVIDELFKERLIAEPVYVFGASVGASVAIQYAAMEPRVRGVMAMAPARDMRSFCRRLLPLLSRRHFEKALACAGEMGQFDPADASAMDAIVKLGCPVLLVHGKLDGVVPHADSQALYAAARGPKELELVPWAGHLRVLSGQESKIVEGIEKLASGRVGAATGQPAGRMSPRAGQRRRPIARAWRPAR